MTPTERRLSEAIMYRKTRLVKKEFKNYKNQNCVMTVSLSLSVNYLDYRTVKYLITQNDPSYPSNSALTGGLKIFYKGKFKNKFYKRKCIDIINLLLEQPEVINKIKNSTDTDTETLNKHLDFFKVSTNINSF
jgi:hypothetical protein